MSVRRNLFISTFLCGLGPALPLAAQEARPVMLGTIHVTAQSDEAGEITATTTPQTHVDADQINRSQGGSVSEVLREVPGVTASNASSLLTAAPAIRGFGTGRHMANDPNVVIAIDGVPADGGRVYQNASGMVADPALLKSIDVLKGPLASLQYGSGIAGGTVAATTIDASDLTGGQPGFRFRQHLGANSNGDGWTTSSTLAWQPDESLEFLANYSRSRLDKQEDGDGETIGLDGYNLPSYLLKARYSFGTSREYRLSFSHAQSSSAERDVPYGQATGSGAFGNVNRDREGTITTVAWEWNPVDNPLLALELKYSRSDQETEITFLPGSPYGEMFGGRYDLVTDRVALTNTAHFRTGNVDHQVVAGVDLSRQTRDNVTMMNPSGKIRRAGVFVIDDMDFGGGLRVSSGLRAERQKIEGRTYTGPMTPPADTGPYQTTALSGGLAVSQEFAAGFTAFGSFAYGEGLATLDVLGSRTIADDLPYADRTEKSRSWEAGLSWNRADLGSGISADARLTAYQTELWDVNTGVSRGGEISRLKMRGIEAQAGLRMESGLYARAGLAISDNDEASVSMAGIEDWQDYSYSPADNGFLTVGQSWDNGLDLSWSLRGAKSITINGTEDPGYGVHDLRVSYSPETGLLAGSSVNFVIENLFDKTYRHNQSYFNEPGRNAKLSISRTF